MKSMIAVAALATLALGGCAMDGQQRAFVQGINNDTAAQPIATAGMWRMPNGVMVPMGYAPDQIAQDQLVLGSASATAPQRSVVVR